MNRRTNVMACYLAALLAGVFGAAGEAKEGQPQPREKWTLQTNNEKAINR